MPFELHHKISRDVASGGCTPKAARGNRSRFCRLVSPIRSQFGCQAHPWLTRSREARSMGNDFYPLVPGGMFLFLAGVFGCGSSDGLNRQAISGT